MTKPVIHPTSQKMIDALLAHTPHAVLLSGAAGVGLGTIAAWIAGKKLAGTIQPTNVKGDIDPQGTIGVETIRTLYERTKSKQLTSQIIIVDDADRMSPGAQAAFLKLLEEPTPHTHFLLTTHHPQKLLSTIKSRTQHTQILPVAPDQTIELLEQYAVTDQTKRVQLQFIAPGLPAAICRLIADEATFAIQAKVITDARAFLQGSPYEKLVLAQRYQSDRTAAQQLVNSALYILRRTAQTNTNQTVIAQLQTLLSIHDNISRQYNIRLQLARFVV